MAQTKLERHLSYHRGKLEAFKQVQIALDTYRAYYSAVDDAWNALIRTTAANAAECEKELDNPPNFLRSTSTRFGR